MTFWHFRNFSQRRSPLNHLPKKEPFKPSQSERRVPKHITCDGPRVKKLLVWEDFWLFVFWIEHVRRRPVPPKLPQRKIVLSSLTFSSHPNRHYQKFLKKMIQKQVPNKTVTISWTHNDRQVRTPPTMEHHRSLLRTEKISGPDGSPTIGPEHR